MNENTGDARGAEDLHQLATPYALDALDRSERERFASHLDGCDICVATVTEVWETMAALSEETETAPPASMRTAVLGRIAATPQVSGSTDVDEPREATVTPLRRNTRWAAVAAGAVGIAAVVVAAVLIFAGSDPIGDVVAAPDAATIQVESAVGTSGDIVFSAELMQAVFRAEGVSDPGDDQEYQFWVITGETPVPANTFVPDDAGRVRELIDGDVAPGQLIAITIEPEGGSLAPTGDILIAQEVQ